MGHIGHTGHTGHIGHLGHAGTSLFKIYCDLSIFSQDGISFFKIYLDISGQDLIIFLVAYLLTSGQGGTLLFKTYLPISLFDKISHVLHCSIFFSVHCGLSSQIGSIGSIGLGVNGGISSVFVHFSSAVCILSSGNPHLYNCDEPLRCADVELDDTKFSVSILSFSLIFNDDSWLIYNPIIIKNIKIIIA